MRFLVTEKELFPLTPIGVVFISELIFSQMENHLVRVYQGEQLIMIKRLYYYSVTVFDLYLSMSTRPNSFLSLTFAMS
jgi:hypothetical protein